MNNLVTGKNLVLDYKEVRALEKVSFSMEKGKVYGLIGRNGAGKTSLLSLLASYRKADSGTLHVMGETPFENARRMQDVQLVYQRDLSDEDDTVQAYLKACADFRKAFDWKYAYRMMDDFNLERTWKVNRLSRGMQACLHVIEGLATTSGVTLFDEIHNGMDAPSRQKFYEHVLRRQEEGPGLIVLSTHLISEMSYLFDHILLIDEGRIIEDSDIETFKSKSVALSGNKDAVDAFSKDLNVIDERSLGGVKSVTVFEALSEKTLKDAKAKGLDITDVPVQDVFISLTKEKDSDET